MATTNRTPDLPTTPPSEMVEYVVDLPTEYHFMENFSCGRDCKIYGPARVWVRVWPDGGIDQVIEALAREDLAALPF